MAKMLVRRSARRQGIALQLLVAIEDVARDLGLVLSNLNLFYIVVEAFDVLNKYLEIFFIFKCNRVSLLSTRIFLTPMTGRTTLVLDTVTGSDAERLYERAGWTKVGSIPK